MGASGSGTKEERQVGPWALLAAVSPALTWCRVQCSRPTNPVCWEPSPKAGLGGLSGPREEHVLREGRGHESPPRGGEVAFSIQPILTLPVGSCAPWTGLSWRPGVGAAAWLVGGGGGGLCQACVRGLLGAGVRPCEGRAGGDPQTRLLAVSPG